MTPDSPALRFLDFYLSPLMARKSIDLLKVDLEKRANKSKDPSLSQVIQIRQVLETLRKRRKTLFSNQENLMRIHPDLLSFLSLAPEDCLLLASEPPFQIPLNDIALATQMPLESLVFRKNQLEEQMKISGITLNHLFNASDFVGQHSIAQGQNRKNLIHSFQSLPMGVRFTIETTGILIGLLGLLWIIPEIRNRYENSIQKRINDYLIESSLVDSPAPEGTSKTPRAPITSEATDDSKESEATSKSSSEEPSQRKQPKVNEGETWRFSFTGSATNEIETGILAVLKKFPNEGQKPVTVPGGIQFDFMLETDDLIPLKTALESSVFELQRKAVPGKNNLMSAVNMSWYKKRNMGTRKIPSAHVQVIIWISTL